MAYIQVLACDFCGKSKDAVETLIAGPRVCICNECVRTCVEILDAKSDMSAASTVAVTDDRAVFSMEPPAVKRETA